MAESLRFFIAQDEISTWKLPPAYGKARRIGMASIVSPPCPDSLEIPARCRRRDASAEPELFQNRDDAFFAPLMLTSILLTRIVCLALQTKKGGGAPWP